MTSTRSPIPVLVFAVLLTAAVMALLWWGQARRAGDASASPVADDAPVAVSGPASSGHAAGGSGSGVSGGGVPAARAWGVLRRWDAARSRAWTRGDPRALAALYTPDSLAGVHDVAMLRRWQQRGLRVVGMRQVVLSLAVRRHAPGRWQLVVADQEQGGQARGSGRSTPLPQDRPDRRAITLRRVGGRWRVASVLPL